MEIANGAGLVIGIVLVGGCASTPHIGDSRSIASESAEDVVMYHLNPARQGWKSNEATLTPANVTPAKFHEVWHSDELDSLMVPNPKGKLTDYAPHVFASPLYLHDLVVNTTEFKNQAFSVVFAATTNGVVYALNATTRNEGGTVVHPGALLWKTKVPKNGVAGALGLPISIPGLDGNLPLGILSTPVIDNTVTPPVMYLASVDGSKNPAPGWKVFALDLSDGHVLWSTLIDEATLKPALVDGTAEFQGELAMSQRGALALGAKGSQLYVPFGAYNDGGTGFMVVVDTVHHKLASAFAADSKTALQAGKPFASGGMWAAGGPALDADGFLYATTGNSPVDSHNSQGTWGQSLLRWDVSSGKIKLVGTYTPFNYCQMDAGDIDLAGSSPIVIDLDPATTSTPHLMAFGGKQGNVYLVDRTALAVGRTARQECAPSDFDNAEFSAPDVEQKHPEMLHPDPGSNGEASLIGTATRSYYNNRPGPLNVFGPYQETFNNGDFAKMRTTPAFFRDASGNAFLFVAGTTRATDASNQNVIPDEIKPGLVRVKVVTQPGQKAFLAIDNDGASTAAMKSAGSPLVTSNGAANAIVWVMDADVRRADSLNVPTVANVPHAILYAYDANTLQQLWKSEDAAGDHLHVGGKYSTPAVADGQVFVGTDRIQSFGIVAP